MRPHRLLIPAGVVVLAAVGFLGIHGHQTRSALAIAADKPAPLPPISQANLPARFAVLSRRHSNQCGLAGASIRTLPTSGRLQGSCCDPMDYARYVGQVNGLARFARIEEVPRDPYDISVRQARSLLAYDQTITLTPAQQKTYRRAMSLASEHGPCCCHCWRWYAFEGQGRELIARRHWSASEVAAVWDLEDGCGGKKGQA